MSESEYRLCIFCRQKEATHSVCPCLARIDANGGHTANRPGLSLSTITPLSLDDEQLLDELQKRPSRLCQRCSDYDIVRVFKCANPLDIVLKNKLGPNDEHSQIESQYDLALGRLSSLVLDSSCSLCRLIYRIMPREALDPDEDMLRLTPFRSYIRESGWEGIPDEHRTNYAMFLALRKPEVSVTVVNSGKDSFQFSNMQLEVIALDSRDTFPGRKWTNSRFVEPMVDMSMVRKALDYCLRDHHSVCQVKPAPGLDVISLIDVHQRKIVPYQADRKYAALSYVWGGVMPIKGALETRKLPQTLEDALMVTKELGLQYIWVCESTIAKATNLRLTNSRR